METSNANALSWLTSLSSGDNQDLYETQPHLEKNSGELQQNITFWAKDAGQDDVSYTWPTKECTTWLTMQLHNWNGVKELSQRGLSKDVWTARTQTFKICVGQHTPEIAQALRILILKAVEQTDPKKNAAVAVKRTTKKRAQWHY